MTWCAAALEGIIANDPFDQQLEAVLSPALGPLLSALSRTPAISNAIASALGSNSGVVRLCARECVQAHQCVRVFLLLV